MRFFPDPATIVSVGGVDIHWLAITLIVGCVAGYLYASDLMKSHGYRQSTMDDLLIIVILSIVIGGRVGWVIEHYNDYRLYMWSVFSLYDGGIDYLFGTLCATFFIFLYTRRKRMSFRRTTDVIIPSILLAVMIAKIGRGLENPRTFAVVGLYALTFFIIVYEFKPYKEGHRRGDMTAITFMLLGMIRAVAMVFELDRLAVDTLLSCVITEAFGILLYFHNHRSPIAPPVILFDFDGTIMDSEGMVLGIFAYLFQKYRTIDEFTSEKRNAIFTMPLEKALEEFFPEKNVDVLKKEYRNFQKSLLGKHLVQTLPKTKETLGELKGRGYTLGIVTSRLTDSCKMWLKDLELEDYFTEVVGTESYRHTKPEPDGIVRACEIMKVSHDSVIYIGDTVKDIQFGKRAGVYTVGMNYHKEKVEELRQEKPNLIIDELPELLNVIDNPHAWSYDLI